MTPLISMTLLSFMTCLWVPTLCLITATSQVRPIRILKSCPGKALDLNLNCKPWLLSRFPDNYPTKVGFAAYSILNGLPTICGGSSNNDEYLDACYSLTYDSGWQLIGALGEGKRMTGFARLDENSLFVTGKAKSNLLCELLSLKQ